MSLSNRETRWLDRKMGLSSQGSLGVAHVGCNMYLGVPASSELHFDSRAFDSRVRHRSDRWRELDNRMGTHAPDLASVRREGNTLILGAPAKPARAGRSEHYDHSGSDRAIKDALDTKAMRRELAGLKAELAKAEKASKRKARKSSRRHHDHRDAMPPVVELHCDIKNFRPVTYRPGEESAASAFARGYPAAGGR